MDYPTKRGRGGSGPRDLEGSAGTWGGDSLEDSAQSLRQQAKRRGAGPVGGNPAPGAAQAAAEPAAGPHHGAADLTALPGFGGPADGDVLSGMGAVVEAARSGLEEEEEGGRKWGVRGSHSFAWALAGEGGAAAAASYPWAPTVEPTPALHSSESTDPVAVTSAGGSYFSSSEDPGMSLESSVSALLSSSDHGQQRGAELASSGGASVPEPPRTGQTGGDDLSASLQSLSLEASSESAGWRGGAAAASLRSRPQGLSLHSGHARGRLAPRLRVPTTPRGQALDRLSPTARELLRASQAYKAGQTTLQQYRWRKDAILRSATPRSRLRATVESAPFLVPTPSNGPRPPGAR